MIHEALSRLKSLDGKMAQEPIIAAIRLCPSFKPLKTSIS